VHANGGERVAHLVQLERLNNSHHDFHFLFPVFLGEILGLSRLLVAAWVALLSLLGRVCRTRSAAGSLVTNKDHARNGRIHNPLKINKLLYFCSESRASVPHLLRK
jgi:hypothetical protein